MPTWRTWRKVAYVLLLAILLALVVIYWRALAAIWREQALTFVGAMGIMACGTFVQAHNFLEFLATPMRPRIRRFAPIWAWSALANYVAPLQAGGIAIRVGWLTRHDVGIAESLLATWRQLVVSVWVSLIGLTVGLLLTGDPRGRWPAFVLFLAWLAVPLLRRIWLRWLDGMVRPRWLAGRRQLLHQAVVGITLRGIVGVVMQYILGGIVVYWVYTRFGAPIGAGQALVLACIVYVSTVVAVLPANLGVLEVIYMFVGHGFGMSVVQVGALALLLRVAHIASNALLALCGAIVTRGAPDHPRNVQ